MSKTTHGMAYTRIYRTYKDMVSRCHNPKDSTYKYYGEKGIEVCKEWREDRVKFFSWANTNGYTDDLTIDREDGLGNYEPSNCRWVDRTEQARNMPNQKVGKTGVRGVSIAKQWVSEHYRATITINNRSKTIGYAKTIKEAAELRNKFIDDNGFSHIKSEVQK